MNKILCAADGVVPALWEVEEPRLVIQLKAVRIGTLQLVISRLEKLVNSFNLSDTDVSLDNFSACLDLLRLYVPDPVMFLVHFQAAHYNTYIAATTWFNDLIKQPDTCPVNQRRDIVLALYAYLDEQHEVLSQEFERCFNYIVHVSEDERILVAKFE